MRLDETSAMGGTVSSMLPFGRVVVINLPQRTDRRREIEKQLALLGLDFDSPGVELFGAVRPDDAGGFDSIGARGCFMSHLQILRSAAGLASVLILEDDLDFAAGIRERLPAAVAALPATWGIFYGGCDREWPSDSRPVVRIGSQELLGTTHFVAFSGAIVPRVVAHLEAILRRPGGHRDGGPMHVDGAYFRFRQANPDIDTYVATPLLGFQRPSRTDIHPGRWFDRVPIVRDAVEAIRRWRTTTGKASKAP